MKRLLLEIAIDQIPAEFLSTFTRKDGSQGAVVKVWVSTLQAPDRFGNTHTAYIAKTREQLAESSEYIYVGKGSTREVGGGQSSATSTAPAPTVSRPPAHDDEPF